jgi:hypothetical protein
LNYLLKFVVSNFKTKIYFMSVGAKHMATFLLGAAAGLAAFKYMSMTPEEKEKLAADLKDKASKFKAEAENAADKAKDYFTELRTKGADALKEHLGDADNILHNLFGTKPSSAPGQDTKSV